MEKLDPTKDGRSPDVIAENIEKLRELFPEAFTEGSDQNGPRWKVDFDTLKEIIGEYGEKEAERYSFTWNGKSRARLIAQTPSTGTQRPCPKESVNWDTTKNLFIEGDNLEVLKLLQKSYHKTVKMIYIDPPYNTGNDFIYPDKFADNLDTYLRYTGQINDEGFKISTNAETGGRYHTNWLNMMYPRLKVARNLLRDDGFFAVSIDDAELSNLTRVMDEIFGEENRVAVTVWDRNRKNDAKLFSVGHEYIVVYAKSKHYLREQKTVLREPKPGMDTAFDFFRRLRSVHGDDWEKIQKDWRNYYSSLDDEDPEKPLGRFTKVGPRGPYRDDGDISWPGGGGPKYEVLHPKTNEPCKIPKGGWVYSTHEKFHEAVEEGKVVFGPDHTTLPRHCRYLFESEGQVMPSVFYSYAQTATMDFVGLMGERVFDNPKNWKDMKRIVGYLAPDPEDLILDFFAGSCSTAHAVLGRSVEEKDRARFIVVQLPEPCSPDSVAFTAGYSTIAEVGKERIRRAIGVVEQEHQIDRSGLGFKVLKLDSSNIKPWDADFDTFEHALLDSVDNIKPDRSQDDVLYELLLKYGLDLAVRIEKRTVVGSTVYVIGGGALIVCLANGIDAKLAEGIVEIRDEIQPDIIRVVFKDSGFTNDVAKTNVMQVLKQAGIEDVKSL